MTEHITPHRKPLLDEFEDDWRLAGLAPKTATEYVRHLHSFLILFPEPTAMNAKQWLEQCPTAPNRRYKARALRRGWAVHALRNGVSEVCVRTIAGWSIGAMVAR